MKIAVFLDGRPGHEKQSLGIVKELGKCTRITTREIQVPKIRFWQQVIDYLRYLFGDYGPFFGNLSGYDLLIGTGTATHLPMLFSKAKYHVPVITCMTPFPILRKSFDLCCVPQHDGVKDDLNIFQTVGPPNCSEANNYHEDGKSLLLLGGIDKKSHHWSTDEVEEQVAKLVSVDETTQWTISTSPRTPADTTERIMKLSQRHRNINFFCFKDTPSGWVEMEYNRNKTVWVTADSMSMVYEALSAGCSVGILPVRWKRSKSKFIRSEKYLIEQNIVLSFESWQTGKLEWPVREPLNEAKKCAEEIVRRWKIKRLQ